MNGIHDLGGMDGFGSIEIEADEPVFHHPWEGWVYSIYFAGMGNLVFNIDEFRHSIERMRPDEYLDASYYERWLAGIEQLLVEKGALDREAIEAREAALETGEVEFPADPETDVFGELVAGFRENFSVERPEQEPAFGVGDRVRVRNRHPEGHTRCPRYARRSEGVIQDIRGTNVVPDSHAHGGEAADPVYNVRFEAAELWGTEAADRSAVHLDLWERYLEPTASA